MCGYGCNGWVMGLWVSVVMSVWGGEGEHPELTSIINLAFYAVEVNGAVIPSNFCCRR